MKKMNYNYVENVSGICFFRAVLFPNVPELGVERKDTKQKKNRNDDYKSTAHLLSVAETTTQGEEVPHPKHVPTNTTFFSSI